jgi:hypothetical protein
MIGSFFRFNEYVFNWVWMEVDNLHNSIQLQNNDLNYKACLPENSDATTMGYFHGSADFTCFRKVLRNQYADFRAAVREFGRGYNILEQHDLELIDAEEVFGPLKFHDYPINERDLNMFSGESFYESLFGDVQRSGNPDN